MTTSSTIARLNTKAAPEHPTTRRLAVAWQNPTSRLIEPVAMLGFDGESYEFWYLHRALDVKGFRPFLGFPDIRRTYHAGHLFPLFAQRVMNPRRPDYHRYLQFLDLPADAGPWEQLARSEGRRVGDTIQVFPEPIVTAGSTNCLFLVHGIRHVEQEDPEVSKVIEQLSIDEHLILRDEKTNPVDRRAVLTTTRSGRRLGWVPHLLLDYVHTVRAFAPPTIQVEHSNGADAPPHMRLLVKLQGRAPDGYTPFDGRGWEPMTDS